MEKIETYQDVNEFLKNYKRYFNYITILPIGYNYIFEFNKIKSTRTLFIEMSINIYNLSEKSKYAINGKKEPNIRAYIWKNKEYINKELQKRAEINKLKEIKEKEDMELEKEIRNYA